jgi:hypothetical protein
MPDYPRHDVQPATPEGGVISWKRTEQAGVYTIKLSLRGTTTSEDVLFSRLVNPSEGDLKTGGQTMLTSAFGSDKFKYILRSKAADPVNSAGGHEYWQYLLAVLLGLIALEIFLGQKFGHYT